MIIKINFYKITQVLICVCFLLIFTVTKLAAEKIPNSQRSNDNNLLGFPGSLKGKIILQSHTQGNMSVALTVQFYLPGNIQPEFTYDVQSDINGEFVVENINSGDYVVTVKNNHTLLVAAAVGIIQDKVTIVEFAPLLKGDANNDNQITESDFSLLSKAFGTIQGGKGYDSAADFNADATISVLDFSLLAENYNKKGYQVTVQSYTELSSGGNIGFLQEESDNKRLQANLFRQ
jgi:hypothetical protein